MPRSRKRIVIIWAKGMLVFLVLTHAGEASLARQVHHGIRSLRDWPCVKGEQFLRHSRGSPVWLSSAELMERAIDRQELERPALLGPSGLHGEVTVQLLIEKDGGVKCVRGIRGNALAISSAVYSLPKWTFKPYVVDAEPKSVLGVLTIPYDFR
jgi:hypothetical protein